MKHILFLEDDEALCRGIALALETDLVSVRPCRTIREAEALLSREQFDLAILDVNLPDGSGLELLRQVRSASPMPVILLTANDTELDVVSGLESGADDYISKPFSLAILRARVNAQLRRSDIQGIGRYCQDGFQFDFDRLEYSKNGSLLEFSKTEQKLLRFLVENRGITLSRQRLMELVWHDSGDYVDENALSVTIKRLRDKLEETPSKPKYIRTIYGIGYQWVTGHE